ncbi:receptor-type tyrosine-protein phosphatase eta isoform X1 [Heptranchias perlo]|uniref:receptor-type tyrosine-protein phosphatase eta isoform X1 n=1 Tax=Heptranchias perlo TaxID=212740 RepID=UPI0035597F5C
MGMEPSWRNAVLLLVGSVLLLQGIIATDFVAKPGDIVVTDITNTSISLSWGRPAELNATQYNFSITYSSSNGNNSITEATNFTTITDLQSGTNYTIAVVTIVNETKSDPVVKAVFTKPNEVQNVKVVDASTNFVTLKWMRPMDYQDVYQYMVQTEGNPAPTSAYRNITVINENATISGLTPGTKYNFTITTLAADGTRANSVMVSSYTKPAQIPQENITVENNGTVDKLIVSWIPPPGNVEEFFVVVKDVKTSEVRADNTASTSPVTITGLRPGRVYNVTVITNSGYFNVTSDNVQGITVPSIPGSIHVTNFSTSSISLNWGAPADMDVGSYTFNVTYNDSSTTESMTAEINSTTISNLTSGTGYTISVATIGPGGLQSDFVSITQFTVPSIPGSINVTNFSTSSISLNWGAPADMDVGSYTFNVTYNDSSTTESMTAEMNSTTISNLASGTGYTISVATIGPGGLQSNFVSITQFTKPNPVSNIQVVNVNTRSITLNWTRPIEYGKEYTYMVLTKRSSAPTDVYGNVTVKIENITVEDLTPGIEYTFTVITLAADGTPAASVIISSYTKTVQVPHENITVENNGTVDKLIVSWIPPPGKVEEFFVIVKDVKTNEVRADNTASTLPVTFTGLRPGREYNITVITNSGPFNVTSDNVQGITVPSIPGSINVTNFSTSSISLNWGAPADMDVGSYTFNVTYSDSSTTESKTAEINSTTISNLTSGTGYTISVATIGPGGLQSDFVSITQFTVPNSIQNLEIVQTDTTSIILKWKKPFQYKDEYHYRVLTAESPAPTGSNGNQTVKNENATVLGLTPGTNYTFSVITLAQDGTAALPVTISTYTAPMKIPTENISLSNKHTTDSLTVSWIHPPGGVENFKIDIEDSLNPTSYKNSTTVPSSTNSVVFSSLRPGRKYNVNVTTISGSHDIPSDSVTRATIPSPPGIIVVTNITNSTIEIGWGRPEDMDIGGYNFSVTYQMAQAANTTFSTADNQSRIPDLNSGTQYNITVLTTGPESFISSFKTIYLYTQPNPVINLSVVSTNSTSIHLTWDEPLGYKSEYMYRVQTDGTPSSSTTVGTKFIIVSNLTSGDKFTFTVFTKVADGTEGNSVTLLQCTDAAAISSSSLKCQGVDLNPILHLEWTCPIGVNTGFRIQTTNSLVPLTESLECNPGQRQQFNLTNVTFFTSYTVNITTLSCGLQSTPTSIDCMSGITQPSLPPVKLTLPGLEITHKTIKFSIGEDTFNSSSGPIVAIAVIVTKEQSNNIPDGKTIETAFSPAVSAYTTQVIQLQTGTQSTRAAALTDPIPVIIGNDSESFGYINKELTPLTGYQISLAGFTKIEFDNAHKKIVANKSFFSAYYYSERITSHQNPDVIIGAVVGCVLGAIVISLLVLLLIWWKKRTKSDNKSVTQLPIPNIRVARNAINVDYFEGYFSKQHADSDCGFAEEYEELKTVGTLQSTQVSQQLLNKPKNRYSNVLPYDTSRVKLSVTEDPSSDYINANFMPGYNSKKEFIAAQGPLLNTVSDFWRMIWEHYVPAIVMLTKCVEQGRAKCEQYWPTERPLIFEDKIISLTSEVILPDWTIRDFTIVKDKSGEKHALRQFHFTGWPDHGVPNTTEVLIEFRNLVRQYINQHPMSGPTVVHCSAGVGRTGTFISIDHMIYQIDNNRKVDIWGTVYQLRMNRPLMVQTESQYVFLNQCAMEYIRSSKQQTSDTIYQNAPALIYENTSALRAAQMANGHAL